MLINKYCIHCIHNANCSFAVFIVILTHKQEARVDGTIFLLNITPLYDHTNVM